jgi:hypothetical protein
VMDSHIKKALVEKEEDDALELWQVHVDHIALVGILNSND